MDFIYLYFDILNDGLCLYSLWSYVGHSACPPSLGPQRKVFVCVVMLFYSQTESLHNTAEVVGMRVGLIGTKRGFILVFTLCNRHNCVIKKNRIFFQHTWKLCFDFSCLLVVLCPCMFGDHYRILVVGEISTG